MAPKPKKPGLTVAIGVEKPKSDLSGPGPLEKPKAGPPKPSKPYGGSPKPPTPPPSEDPMDEMGEGAPEGDETPAEENNEEYGEKLISDMSAPLAAAGVAPEHVKPVLSALFRAIADCIDKEGQGGDEGAGADMGGPPPPGAGGPPPMGGQGGY